jgi:hypothetical protein
MSGDHAKKEMDTGEKPTTSHGKATSEESRNKGKGKEKKASSHKSHRSGDKKKKMRKVVYYETDTSSPSTSGSDAPSVTSKRHERKKFSKIPLRYPHIPKHTPLLSVPLGKPPTFDGEDYARWSDLMKFHVTSLHKSIWNVVEFGAQVPSVGDEDYDEDEVAQIEDFNSQATTILLASLSREEYNKMQGLKSAKEVWDVLKTTHEGDELTKITKRETIEGELGRFRLRKGEEPQDMYNRLKTLVNQVRNLGSKKWDDHEMAKDVANIAINKGLLFPNVGHKCLMAKDGKKKKVKSKSSTKYESSSDDNASDEEDNLRTLFANLNMQQKEKLNELISAIHEKDDLLDTQEDFLIKENKKHVKVKNAYALEVEKCEKLTSELSTCHDIINNLRNENASLVAKVDSNVCDVSIPNLRNDNDNLLAKIEELNITLASLRNENEKIAC